MVSVADAQQHYRQGRAEEAARVCRRLLNVDPGNSEASNLLGIIEFQAGNLEAGLSYLLSAAESTPPNSNASCNYAQALMQMGRLEDAVAGYRRALEIDPRNVNALVALAMALQQLELPREAERVCREGVHAEPGNPVLLLGLGTVLAMQGRHDEAIESLRSVLDIEPGHPVATVNLANALQETGQLDEALKLYRQVLSREPGHVDALVNVGHLLNEKGDQEGALSAYQTALSVDARCAEACYYAGALLQQRGAYNGAIEHFQKALAEAPDFERAHWGLQQCFLLKAQPDRALEACSRCLDVLPDNQMTIANQAFANLMNNDEDRFEYLYSLERFPHQALLDPPDRYASVEALNDALTRDIMSHPSLKWQHDDYDTSDRAFAYGLLDDPSVSVKAFENSLRASIKHFIAGLENDETHPFFGRIPSRYRLKMWATVIQYGGWHRAHNHEKAWASGVYYVRCPQPAHRADTSYPGWIEFDGFTHYFNDNAHRDKVRRVQPEPGLMLLFPSYMLHATHPFAGDGYRVSIAFDVQPLLRQREAGSSPA